MHEGSGAHPAFQVLVFCCAEKELNGETENVISSISPVNSNYGMYGAADSGKRIRGPCLASLKSILEQGRVSKLLLQF